MSGVTDDDGEPEAPLYYAARLLLSHPDMDPARISEGLDRVPRHVHRAGDKIVTPDGSEPAGRWYDTRWSIGWDHLGDERVFAFAETILDGLAPKTAFLNRFAAEGGHSELIIMLYGRHYLGCASTPRFLRMLCDMDITLGLEVYHDWNTAERALRSSARG